MVIGATCSTLPLCHHVEERFEAHTYMLNVAMTDTCMLIYNKDYGKQPMCPNQNLYNVPLPVV